MIAWFRVVMSRVVGFLRPTGQKHEFDQEIAAHLALAEDEKVAQGIPRKEARRLARVELGGVAQLREATAEARGLPWLDAFGLDLKLALRMLRKQWALSLVGGLAMAVVISIGVVVFAFFDLAFDPKLPLDEGERVVGIQTWDAKAQEAVATSLADVERWRTEVRSLENVGAFQSVRRNLIIGESRAEGATGRIEPVYVAEMSAAGFELARSVPILGRPLVAADETMAAAPVLVVGYSAWQDRFDGDPEVVGTQVRLGSALHTVVGVMPEGFRFPVNQQYWTALTNDQNARLASDSDSVVFARLASGATVESAQAELEALGLLDITEPSFGATTAAGNLNSGLSRLQREQIKPRVQPYVLTLMGAGDQGQVAWFTRIIALLAALLLAPPCANIAILVYAKTMNRQQEFAARYALGASRSRVVSQLFAELLVLALVAAALSLVVAHGALRWASNRFERLAGGDIPFWMDFSLSLKTVAFAGLLAVGAALSAGLVPALKATRRQLRSGARLLGNRSSMPLGATWAALVIAQVAISLAVLPIALEIGWGTVREGVLGPGFDPAPFVTAQLSHDEGGGALLMPDDVNLQREFMRRLKSEPEVAGATIARIPGAEPWRQILLDHESLSQESRPQQNEAGIAPLRTRDLVRTNAVDQAFFDVFPLELMAGRTLEVGDFESAAQVAVISRTLALRLAADGNPLGHRLRLRTDLDTNGEVDPEPNWHTVVGVVGDRPRQGDYGTVYLPLAPSDVSPSTEILVRLAAGKSDLTERLRDLAVAVDPALRVEKVQFLQDVYREQQVGNTVGAATLGAVTLCVLLLSAAGLYALMSFTVNQRRHEIGIRTALGAQPGRLLASVFKRVATQFAAGACLGVVMAATLNHVLPAERLGGWDIPGIIPIAALLMLAIAIATAAGPGSRGLRVDPIEELREG